MLTLATLLTITAAFFADDAQQAARPDEGERDLPDWELWNLVANEGDVLGDMSFAQAVAQDPRRVEALLIQRVQIPLQELLAPVLPPNLLAYQRQVYLQRNAELRGREHTIAASRIAEAMTAELSDLQTLLEQALWPMAGRGDRQAQAIQEALVIHGESLLRGLREARAIANKAAEVTSNATDAAAWREIGDVVRQVWAPIVARIEHIEAEVPRLPWNLPEEKLEEILREHLQEGDMAILPVPYEEGEDYGALFGRWSAHP